MLSARNGRWLVVIVVSLTIISAVAWVMDPITSPGTRRIIQAMNNAAPKVFGTGLPRSFNGFDVSNATIPVNDILSGGVARDGIPALTEPSFVNAADVDYLVDGDMVVGIAREGVARAYPLRIIVWHEVVNDVVAGKPLAITYCPLCGTCMVFDREYDGKTLSFGVSGLLYQSDVLMYDHQTESLWSQLKMESVSGELAGKTLTWLPSNETTWKAWRELHPDTQVLSIDTGYSRRYGDTAYANYKRSDHTIFPVPVTRKELGIKEWVVGIIVNGEAKAYPIEALKGFDSKPLSDTVGGQGVEIRYDVEGRRATAKLAESGEPLPTVKVYWFAWQAFYPDTGLFER